MTNFYYSYLFIAILSSSTLFIAIFGKFKEN
jgi:hypothetical protein